jgi:hypothetical protein
MNMSEYQRKEIIKIDGLTILMGMALIANMLIVGFFYRYHGYQLYVEEKAHNLRMKELNNEAHQLKEDIIAIEGVKTWNDSVYAKLLQ